MKRDFDKDTTLTLDYESGFATSDKRWHETSAISEDAVGTVCDALNDGADGYKYSMHQVRAAMWIMLKDHIDDYLEDIEDYFDRLTSGERDRLLGEPEIDIAEERRLEAGDVKFDAARDKQMEVSAT